MADIKPDLTIACMAGEPLSAGLPASTITELKRSIKSE